MEQAYWQKRYLENDTPWNIGEPSTPLKEYIDQLTNQDLRILIPGAGFGHEAIYLSQLGFKHITVIELVPESVDHLKAYPGIKVIVADLFEHEASYDLILEQTLFCAILPEMREKYISKIASLLSNEGKYVGVLFNRVFEKQGPPFGGNSEEYQALFFPVFKHIYMQNCYNSIPQRAGSEVFIQLSN